MINLPVLKGHHRGQRGAGGGSLLCLGKYTSFENLSSSQLRSKRFPSGAPEIPIPQALKDINSRFLAIFNVF